MSDLPTPLGYRQSVPAFPNTELGAVAKRATRRRHIIWFSVAVALHLALFLGWWLTPPLRLKAGYAPDRWVPVVSIPRKLPDSPMVTPEKEPLPSPKTKNVNPKSARPAAVESHPRRGAAARSPATLRNDQGR